MKTADLTAEMLVDPAFDLIAFVEQRIIENWQGCMAAYEAGFSAYWGGASCEASPFELSELESKAWVDGWKDGESEAKMTAVNESRFESG